MAIEPEQLLEEENIESDHRFEKKFYTENYVSVKEIESIVKTNPAFFRETFTERQVNSIYLDTP